MRCIGALVTMAALLALSTAQQTDCDLGDPAALGRCLSRLLDGSRDKVRQEADPLHLPDHNDGELRASDIVVRGLADYNVEELSVTFPTPQQIAMSASISWPRIVGDLSVRLRKCKRIIFGKKLCATARARPHVTVGTTVGTLTTTLTVNADSHGQLTVEPSNTAVTLQLPSVSVRANLRGAAGAINRLIGDPASRIVSKLANKWWRENKPKLEQKVRQGLEKAVREDLSVHLADLLQL